MLKGIDIRSESGQIKAFWEWEEDETASVDIRYKCSEISSGDGAEFTKGGVIRHPGEQIGNAYRKLSDERGLYTFTFIPRMKNGMFAEKIVVENVMLGEPVKVYWGIENQKDGMMITFSENQITIKPRIVCLVYGQYQCVFHYEISAATKLLFPVGMRAESFFLKAVEPYDKVYKFIRR